MSELLRCQFARPSDHKIASGVIKATVQLVVAVVAMATATDARVTNTRLSDAALDSRFEVIATDGNMASKFFRFGLGGRLRRARSRQY